jgi:hypothetical protein
MFNCRGQWNVCTCSREFSAFWVSFKQVRESLTKTKAYFIQMLSAFLDLLYEEGKTDIN